MSGRRLKNKLVKLFFRIMDHTTPHSTLCPLATIVSGTHPVEIICCHVVCWEGGLLNLMTLSGKNLCYAYSVLFGLMFSLLFSLENLLAAVNDTWGED